MKIALIGFGNMGSAIYFGLKKVFPEKDLLVCDRRPHPGIKNFFSDANKVLAKADCVILAIKPQQFGEFAKELFPKMRDKLVISIMAGISVANIKKMTGSKRVIRTMPNLAALVGESVTGWVTGKDVSAKDEKFAERVLSSFGIAVKLKSESMINALTAVSGCGPAYFFLLTELLQKKAERLGFSKEDAQLMAEKTMEGSAKLVGLNLKSAGEWKKSVASKGGSTEQALKYFQKQGLARIVSQGVERAKKKAADLNRSK